MRFHRKIIIIARFVCPIRGNQSGCGKYHYNVIISTANGDKNQAKIKMQTTKGLHFYFNQNILIT